MDIFRLDSTSYLPDALVEGYNSMIWTERYAGAGEFEMRTFKVFETLQSLPQGCFISLRDSNEMMLVETRTIEVDDDGIMELTVKGRTFDTFLENRVMLSTVYNEKWKVFKPYNTAGMISMLFWNHLVNTTVEDPTKPTGNYIDQLTAVANVVVTDSTTISESTRVWYLQSGDVYTQLRNFLPVGQLGIRTVRPNRTTADIVTFDTTTTSTRGNLTKTTTANIPQVRLDVYNGVDRSYQQDDRPAVIFHYDSGHIDNPSYLFSIKDYKNMVAVSSDSATPEIWAEGTTSGGMLVSGLNRRVMFLDGGSIGDQDSAEFLESLTQRGRVELKKHSQARMLDGQISPISPYRYGEEYFLGDKVTFLAQLDFEATLFVSEYVRTEDASGDRGYPGLSSIPD